MRDDLAAYRQFPPVQREGEKEIGWRFTPLRCFDPQGASFRSQKGSEGIQTFSDKRIFTSFVRFFRMFTNHEHSIFMNKRPVNTPRKFNPVDGLHQICSKKKLLQSDRQQRLLDLRVKLVDLGLNRDRPIIEKSINLLTNASASNQLEPRRKSYSLSIPHSS